MAKTLLIVLSAIPTALAALHVEAPHIPPIRIPLKDEIAGIVAEAIVLADMGDAKPNDSSFEIDQHIREPIRINLYFTHLATTVDLDVEAKLSVLDENGQPFVVASSVPEGSSTLDTSPANPAASSTDTSSAPPAVTA